MESRHNQVGGMVCHAHQPPLASLHHRTGKMVAHRGEGLSSAGQALWPASLSGTSREGKASPPAMSDATCVDVQTVRRRADGQTLRPAETLFWLVQLVTS